MLDIHDKSIYAVIVDISTGEILCDRDFFNGYAGIAKELSKYKSRKKDLTIAFEAGGHGYFPYYFFTNKGFKCQMIAPHSIPNKNRQKTDRIDCFENIKDLLAGNLRFVTVADKLEVDAREILRNRFTMTNSATKQKQKITAALKRHGIQYDGKTRWSKTHRKWLRNIVLETIPKKLINSMLATLEYYEKSINEIDDDLNDFFQQHPHLNKRRKTFILIRGIGPLCSMILALEGGDLNRFSHPNKLMTYTGLVPGLYCSGEKNPHLKITKKGNKYLRYAFTCAAKMYRDNRNMYTKAELESFPTELQEFLYKCQRRLINRNRLLVDRGKHTNKARCAVARELCAFAWELAVVINPEIDLGNAA